MAGQHSTARRAGSALCALVLGAGALAGCGDTLEDRTVGEHVLQSLVAVNRFPIYWVGARFEGLALTDVSEDYGGAYSLEYGNCSIGGQSTCVSPLEIVTAPERIYRPGAGGRGQNIRLRGRAVLLLEGGRTLELATGSIVVDVYGKTRRLAEAAAETMVPINEPAIPGSLLPAPAPSEAGPAEPLPGQLPRGVTLPHASTPRSG